MASSIKIRSRGFTMIELMIALTLGLLIAGGVIGVFVESRRGFNADEQVARMQDEARFALDELSRDLRMAGFLSEPLFPDFVIRDPGLAIGTDCGPAAQANWIFNFRDAVSNEINTLTTVDNTTGAAANANYSCIAANEVRVDTDLVGIKRAIGATVAPADLADGESYIRANGTFGMLYTQPPTDTVPAPVLDREYQPYIYFIRNFSDTAGDGVPSLCRKTLIPGDPPDMETECIARGIEDLQLEFGLDTNGDGAPNRYLAAPTLAQLQNAISVRIFLLARTELTERGHTDERTYNLSNAPAYSPADGFRRRLYSLTVIIPNRRNAMQIQI